MDALNNLSPYTFWWRVAITHMFSYFIAGILMWFLIDVEANWDTYEMARVQKPPDSPWVAAATAFQIITGSIWALVLWPFRNTILGEKGWLKLWILLVGLAVIGIEPPAPGAIEGFIYLDIPIQEHLKHLPEHLLQTLICSILLFRWYGNPRKLWNILATIFLIFIGVLSLAILLSSL